MPIVRIEAQVSGVAEATRQLNELNAAAGKTLQMTKTEAEALGKFNKQVTDFLKRSSEARVKGTKETLSGIERINFERDEQIAALKRQQKEIKRIAESLRNLSKAEQDAVDDILRDLNFKSNAAIDAIQIGAQARFAEQTRKNVIKTIDTYVDRWGRGTKNMGEAWKRMQNEMALSFAKFTLRMISRWLFSIKEMNTITSQGFFGSLISLGGRIPGIGGFFDFLSQGAIRGVSASGTGTVKTVGTVSGASSGAQAASSASVVNPVTAEQLLGVVNAAGTGGVLTEATVSAGATASQIPKAAGGATAATKAAEQVSRTTDFNMHLNTGQVIFAGKRTPQSDRAYRLAA